MFKANYTINYNHFKMRTTFLFYLSNLIILKFYFNIQSLCSHYHFFLYLYPISFELSYNPKQLLLLTQISNKSETPFNTLLSYFITWHTSLLFIEFFLLFLPAQIHYKHFYYQKNYLHKMSHFDNNYVGRYFKLDENFNFFEEGEEFPNE